MSDLTTETAVATGGEPGTENAQTTTETGGTTGTETGQTTETRFTQADMDRVVKARLDEQRRRYEKTAEEQKAEADKKRLAEQGEWQRLYEEQKAENDTLKADIAMKDRQALCLRVATEAKLPAHWADRLQGDTEADLKADAERLAKDLAPPTAPNLEMGGGGNGNYTPEQARKEMQNSSRYQPA